MKKLSILASLLIALNTVSAQSTSTSTPMIDKEVQGGRNVPKPILNKFSAEYPGEQPMWAMENGNYRALFVDGSKMHGHAISYDKGGNVVSREEKVTSYPSGVSDYYKTNYPDDKYEVWSSTDKSGKKTYYSSHNLETLWFDENGGFKTKGKAKN